MAKLFTMPVVRIIVLAVAILVWVNLTLISSRTTAISAPLELKNLDAGLAVAEAITAIEAQVSGSLHDVGRLTEDSIVFQLDLSGIDQPGRYSREIKPKGLPDGIRLISFQPKTIVFDVDEEVSKQIPVMPKTIGLVADGYSVEEVTVAPDHITISGASRVIDAISGAKAYVDIDGRNISMTAPVNFVVEDASDRRIQTVRVFPAQGKIAVVIKQGAAFRSLGIRPAFVDELPGGFWVREVIFDPVVVTVRGHQKQLRELAFLTTTPINLKDKTSSFYDQVAIDLPHGVELVGENLIHVRVVIELTKGTRQLSILPKYVNVTEGFGVTTIKPTSVQVVVSGDSDAIAQLKRDDVVLNLDLQGALSGTNSIEIHQSMFTIREGLAVVSFTPKAVEVVLSRLE